MHREPHPNLFIIGAMKSGTTTLHSYLQAHPEIFMCEPKEPFYFVKEKNWNLGERWYLSLFAGAQNQQIIGESTTDYTKIPIYQGVPERIRTFNPDARFIYIMRDPVNRSISHYWHNVRWHSEHRDMLKAIRQDHEYTDVSNYAMQLDPFFRIFGQENVYTLTFEQLTSNPEESLKGIFRWLGVSEKVTLPKMDIRKNVMPQKVQQARAFGLLNRFRFSSFWNHCSAFFPSTLRRTGKSLALKAVDRKAVSDEPSIHFLRSIQIEQVKVLENMLARTFPEWTTLRAEK